MILESKNWYFYSENWYLSLRKFYYLNLELDIWILKIIPHFDFYLLFLPGPLNIVKFILGIDDFFFKVCPLYR